MLPFKKLLFSIALILLLISCSNKNSVKITIETTSTAKNIVYLEKLSFAKSAVIDSAKISKGTDRVTFKVKEVFEPTFFIINFKGKGAITLLAEDQEEIKVKINTDKILEYQVEGSKGSLLTRDLTVTLARTTSKLDSLNRLFITLKDENARNSINRQYAATIDSQRAFSSRFIWANAMSRASVMALYQKFDNDNYVFDRSEDLILFKTVASSLKALYPNSDYTKGMIADIGRMQNLLSNINIQNFIKGVEPAIPDIKLPNPNGDTIKLSSLKGKVVLLDFWASWNQTSLLDNRELLNTYKLFKSKGFEVYQVSLDQNRDDWVNAIESAGLPWINVSSLTPNANIAAMTYNVTQLPANYLIGRDHTIIGKNLYGQELIQKLKELLK